MEFKNPPIFEMSLSTRWTNPIVMDPNFLLGFRDKIKAELPLVEFQPPVQDQPIFLVGAPTEPQRWFFSSTAGELIVQVQNDLFGVNWRKRTSIGDPDENPYPGYEVMLKLFLQYQALWTEFTQNSAGISLEPRSCAMLYDNIWLLPDEPGQVSDVFNFWKSMGFKSPILGPDVRFTSLSDLSTGKTAKVDIWASLGLTQIGDGGKRAARIQMNGQADAITRDAVALSLDGLHSHISDILVRMTTDETKGQWGG
jgi:uncharacterized protein (TIGR04255 family)